MSDSSTTLIQEYRKRIITVSSSQSASAQNDIYLINATGGNVVVTLPPHDEMFDGTRSYMCFFKRVDTGANTATIQPVTGTIDNAVSKNLIPMESVTIISDGSNYQVIRTNGGTANTTIAAGSASTVTVLLLGSTVDLTVPLDKSMPNTTYMAIPVMTNSSASVLGTLSVTVKTKNLNSVVVTLKNTGLASIALGQTVEVIAFLP